MIESVRSLVENSIRREHPTMSSLDVRIAVFKRYYVNDFSPTQLETIAAAFTDYLKPKSH